LEQVYKFRKPMANYQVPQNTLLKYKWVHTIIFYFQTIVSVRLARVTASGIFVHNSVLPTVSLEIK
jgi:hypothetical protein